MEIERYSHTQTTKFSPNRFGFELEVEIKDGRNRQDVADRLDKLLPAEPTEAAKQLVHLKEDGSLRYGFEVVSKPLVLDELKVLLCNVARILRRGDAVDSWDSLRCGFHLHIGAEHFDNALQLTRFLWIFQSNDLWKVLLVPVAGRSSTRWAKQIRRGAVERLRATEPAPLATDATYKYARKTKLVLPGRYYAVNLENPHTVELRLFRGSLQEATLLRYVELMELLLGFSKQPCTGTKTLAWQFRRYYKSVKKTLPHLDAFLKSKQLWCYKKRNK